jgi:hypothetical protein
MKREHVIAMMILMITVSLVSAVSAQVIPDDLQKDIINASAAKRIGAMEKMEKSYPSLPHDLFLFLCDNYPKFPTRYLRARIEGLEKVDSRELARLYLQVTDDMDTTYGEKRREFRKECIKLLTEKDPGLPSDIKAFREKNSIHARFNELLTDKYPNFRKDMLTLMEEKHPGLIMTIARDALNVTIQKDPALFIQLRIEMLSVMEEQFPELLKNVQGAAHNPCRLGQFMRENPKVALALVDRIDTKLHKRIVALKKAVITDLIEKHSKELCATAKDILGMVEKKYPELSKEAVLMAMECSFSFHKEVKERHNEFFKQFQALQEKNLSFCLKDLVVAVDHYKPDFREKMKASVNTEFPDIEKKSSAFFEKKYPGVIRELKASLK